MVRFPGQDGRLEILRLINATDGRTRGEMLAPALEKMLEVGATVSRRWKDSAMSQY